MDYQDSGRAVREEAQALALAVGGKRAALAMTGQRDEDLEEAAEALTAVLIRASAVEAKEFEPTEQKPVVAAMERLDPDEFARRVRARRRMHALRTRFYKVEESGQVVSIAPGPVVRLWKDGKWVPDKELAARLTGVNPPKITEVKR